MEDQRVLILVVTMESRWVFVAVYYLDDPLVDWLVWTLVWTLVDEMEYLSVDSKVYEMVLKMVEEMDIHLVDSMVAE